ncbi:MAG: HutD family protein [Pseudomonadota bacterium]|nr:HutD family protein [Pseudomonadota bacterium]
MDDPGIRILRAGEYRREPWRNGAGWTRQVHAEPSADGTADWDWRLSIAEIDADAPFSAFPGVERELVLLEGNGMRLRFDGGEVHELLPPHDRLRFAGERRLMGELIDGPTRDFNLMWRRDAIDARLWHRPLVGTMLVFVDPGETWAVHVLAGQARPDGSHDALPIMVGDTALLAAGEARRRHMLEGGGELLVMRLGRRPAQ